ncbi:hypothetical protein BT93_E2557 [Corymbia citriodora subsp. variegata]|nr:hypothetical protein BT93_E2557 [Corymbia citriodora subsp. variegata]
MLPFARLRPISLNLLLRRRFSSSSSILSPDSNAPLSSKEKTGAARPLRKTERNPEHVASSVAISKLRRSSPSGERRTVTRDESAICGAIQYYGWLGKIDEAINAFKHVEELGIRRTVKSLNALLHASIEAEDYEETKRIYMEFPRIYSLEPDLETFNTAIEAFCKSGSTSLAYSALAEMDRKGVKPAETTFGNMLDGFYEAEKYEEVGKVLNLTQKYGVSLNFCHYFIRITRLCELRKPGEAEKLLDEMLARGITPFPEAYVFLIHGFCDEGRYDVAKKLFKSMVNGSRRPYNFRYDYFIQRLCERGDFDGALQIFKDSVDSVGEDWDPTFLVMKSLVDGLVSVNKVDEARELITQVKERWPGKTDSWDEIKAGLPQ